MVVDDDLWRCWRLLLLLHFIETHIATWFVLHLKKKCGVILFKRHLHTLVNILTSIGAHSAITVKEKKSRFQFWRPVLQQIKRVAILCHDRKFRSCLDRKLVHSEQIIRDYRRLFPTLLLPFVKGLKIPRLLFVCSWRSRFPTSSRQGLFTPRRSSSAQRHSSAPTW